MRKTLRLNELIWLAFIALPGFLGCEPKPDPALAQDSIPMPAFTGRSQEVFRNYYHIVFQSDGYPAKYADGERFDHPLYGAYVLSHYLSRYKRGEDTLAPYITMVAEAVLKRADQRGDTLWMRYPEGYTRATVSGLTQSRYLDQFSNLYAATGDSLYYHAAKGFFESFKVPISEGGFCHTSPVGVTFEEYPEYPVSYVLNGWLTALWNIHNYRTRISDPEADSLFENSCQALAALLPLYDYPEGYNSLYQLTALQEIKIEFGDTAKFRPGGTVFMDIGHSDGYTIPVKPRTYRNRYGPFWDQADFENGSFFKGKVLHGNLVVSLTSNPEPNTLMMYIKSLRPQTARVYLNKPDVDLIEQLPVGEHWQYLSSFELIGGDMTYRIEIPLDSVRSSLIPTKFSKKVKGKYHNAYHFIHIDKLRKLNEVTGIPEFATWADRWEEYTTHWPEMEALQDTNISLERI